MVVTLAGAEHLQQPSALAIDPATGTVYFADAKNHQIKSVTPDGVVSLVAGSGRPGFQDGTGPAVHFNDPAGLAFHRPTGDLYVADRQNHLIRRITSEGSVSTFAGASRPGNSDGAGTRAELKQPVGIAIDLAGNLYVADTGNSSIRRISSTGVVTTIAGGAKEGFSDGSAASALFKQPEGIGVADDGSVYIADTGNHVIRKLEGEMVTTISGTGHGGFIDGAGMFAEFKEPAGITIDDSGNLFIADRMNHAIRRITFLPAPTVTTVAGTRHPGHVDGSPPFTQFKQPTALVVAGALYIADAMNNAIRVIYPALTLSGIHERSADPSGGTEVRLIGTGFVPGATTVRFGAVDSPRVAWISSTELLVITPEHPIGVVDVTVETPAGRALMPLGFEYRPPYIALEIDMVTLSLEPDQQAFLTATAVTASGTTLNVTTLATWSTSDPAVAEVDEAGLVTAIAEGTAVVEATFALLKSSLQVTVASNPVDPLPPDPATVAPPLDPTRPTGFAEAASFLYSGPTPLQRDVAPGALVERRLAIVRGRVMAWDGEPMPGVRVSIHGEAAVGYTLTRVDGAYDIAVNGGGQVVLAFSKDGYIPAHRRAMLAWHEYANLADTTLIQYDSEATRIDLALISETASARGSSVTDEAGTRRATLLFQPGTTATMHFEDNQTQQLNAITVRATEQSIGVRGAMPADLPPESGYTYCLELSVDEAAEADATSVVFSKPVYLYVENFLGFRVGSAVPSGSYDRLKAEWIASDNGRIIKILSIEADRALVDVDGDDHPDEETAAALGITADERRSLAQLYGEGQTLWRVPITHFTPWDLNWPYSPPADAEYPSLPAASPDDPVEGQSCHFGSIIECESLTLGKSIAITGTPFSLEYRSRNAEGFKARYEIDISLAASTLPASLERIDLVLQIAGQRLESSFSPTPGQKHTFSWNGHDVYDRVQFSDRRLEVEIGYVYKGVYREPADVQRAFAAMSSGPVTFVRSRRDIVLSQVYTTVVRARRPDQGLGGWTLNSIHTYDREANVLQLGTGSDMRMEARGTDAKPIGWAQTWLYWVKTGPDGSIYPYAPYTTVVRVAPDGEVTPIAGGGTLPPSDGVPALQTRLALRDLEIHPNGDILVLDDSVHKIFRIRNGILSTVVSGVQLTSLTIGPGGVIYYIDAGSLWRSDGGGNTSVVAAADAAFTYQRVRAGRDGTLFLLASEQSSGLNSFTVMLRWELGGRRTRLGVMRVHPVDFAVDGRGRVLFSDRSIKFMDTDGTIRNLAAARPAKSALGVAITPNDELVYVEAGGLQAGCKTSSRCVVVAGWPVVPVVDETQGGAQESTAVTPSGTQAFRFSKRGRHLETRDPVSGSVVHRFSYDHRGYPLSIEDSNGLFTRVERADDGSPVAIVARNGSRTELELDSQGRIARVYGPAGQSHEVTFTTDGLLQTYRDARGHVFTYSYDARGRLAGAEDAAGGSKQLTQASIDGVDSTQLTTAGNQTWLYTTKRGHDRSTLLRTATDPAGLRTVTAVDAALTTVTLPDESSYRIERGHDPQWGTMAPVTSAISAQLPSGRTLRVAMGRSVVLSDSEDPLSVSSIEAFSFVNGRSSTSSYKAIDRSWTTVSAGKRTVTELLDMAGRTREIRLPSVTPLTFGYDSRGRTVSVAQGARSVFLDWNANDELAAMTDALGRTVRFAYDEAGRVISQQLPDDRTIGFTYDMVGNLTSVIPPSGTAHTLSFTPVNLPSTYNAPSAGAMSSTRYLYDLDRRLTRIVRPDQTTIDFNYGPGRLLGVASPDRSVTFNYNVRGQVTSVTESGGEALTFSWDGPLATAVVSSGQVAGSVSWTYDSDFRVSGEAVNGSTVTFGYDADSLLTRAGQLVLNRDVSSGRLTGSVLHAIGDQYQWNAFGEVTGYSASYNATELVSYAYALDVAGRIKTIGSRAFEYDLTGRLTGVAIDGQAVAEYEYDANGNRTAHRWVGGSSTASYDEQDRLLQYGDTQYQYSANGELTAKTLAGAVTTYDYGAFGHLRKVVLPGGRTIEYVTDPQGRRVGKKIDGTLAQRWLYADQLRIVAELDGPNTSRFVYGSRVNAPDLMIKGGVTYRIIVDHLGSPRLIVNAVDGTIAQRLEYDEFGRVLSDTNPGFQPFGFAGGLYDRDTGLVRFGARDYDPHTGRFVTKDPIGFAGGDTNLYAYVMNDPINLMDPMGTDWMSTTASFSAGFGDALLLGFGDDLRGWTDETFGWGGGALVDKCSGAYSAGEWTGIAASTLAGGAAGAGSRGLSMGMSRANAAFPRGIEWVERSHWIAKFKNTRVDGAWNLQKMWGTDHALADPARYRMLRRWWKAQNPIPGPLSRQIARVPDYAKGAAVGAAYGGAGAGMSGCGCN